MALLCAHVTDCDKFSPAATTIMLMFLVFESLLFGLFTAIMCTTQLSAIASDYSVCILRVILHSQSHMLYLSLFTSSSDLAVQTDILYPR